MANARSGRLRRRTAVLTGLSTAALCVATATPAAAGWEDQSTASVHGANGPNAIEDSYIVVLDDAARMSDREVETEAHDLAESYDAEVGGTYDSAVQGFTAEMDPADAEELAADDAVKFVEANQQFAIFDTQLNAPWGLDRVDQRALPLDTTYTYETTAANVNAYIIDTGIDVAHPDLEGRAQVGTDTVGDGRIGQDCNGHGTHVAGTVGSETYGLAKDVNLWAVRVLDCEGSGTIADVIEGIEWVADNAVRPAVANMSLGGNASPVLDAAVSNSIASGVTYAVAAGNEGTDACASSPARVPEALTAGASDRGDARAAFSNVGGCLDLFAPGVDIESTVPGGGTDVLSGTSMASPHVAGAAALYLSTNPDATPAQVGTALTGNATQDLIQNPGTRSPNLLLYTGGE